MRELAERGWFDLCRTLGRLLRAAKYAESRIVFEGGSSRVRKRRLRRAPLLVALGGPLVELLDTGVRILPQPAWEERERLLWRALHGASIAIGTDGTLVLPCLPGETLAALLEDRRLERVERDAAIHCAALALADLHRHGFTHGDAMAENVMVDREAGTARWFDFETLHDAGRSDAWRRADDVRALLATTLLRTPPAARAATLHLILDAYGDAAVVPPLAASFASAFRRPLPFHLGQAALSYPEYRVIARLLRERIGSPAVP